MRVHVYVSVYVCVNVVIVHRGVCLSACVRVSVCMCECSNSGQRCVCVRVHVYVSEYVYVNVVIVDRGVCVCMCVREHSRV